MPGSGGAAVDPDDGSRGEARRLARQVDGGADDLRGLAAALEGERRPRSPPEGVEVPRLADVREERTRLDRVHSHLGREGAGEAHGHGLEPGLRRRVRYDVGRGTARRPAADVDDRAPVPLRHAAADERGETKGTLEIDGE